jgi:Arc/MetJ-type ribon-helix-helix transcriptional regulator
MTIHLSKDLEQFVQEAVRAGHYASEEEVVSDAVARLRLAIPKAGVVADQPTKRKRPIQRKKTARTEAELRQYMLDIGLMSQLPDTAADFDDPDDQLITIKGAPLSETIIRERRSS